MPLRNVPPGTPVHNLELVPGGGGKLVRGAGTSATVAAKEGKYALVVPRHLLSASATLVPRRTVHLTLAGRYLERRGGGPDHAVQFVLDGRLGWELPPWLLTLQGTNLLDRDYEEIPGVPMPGRLATLTVGSRF